MIVTIADLDTIPEEAGEQTIELLGIGAGASNEEQSFTITTTSSKIGPICRGVTEMWKDSTKHWKIENVNLVR